MADSTVRKKINFSKSTETYNLFLDAAELLIEEAGLNNFSTPDVAKKSGFGVGTLYLYFDDKQTILEALLRREILNCSKEFVATILPKLPLSPAELLYEFYLLVLNRNKNKIYFELLSMASVSEGIFTGRKISELILEKIEIEIKNSLKIELDLSERKKKAKLLFYMAKGLLSMDENSQPSNLKCFNSIEQKAQWLTDFTLNFLTHETISRSR